MLSSFRENNVVQAKIPHILEVALLNHLQQLGWDGWYGGCQDESPLPVINACSHTTTVGELAGTGNGAVSPRADASAGGMVAMWPMALAGDTVPSLGVSGGGEREKESEV